MSWNIKVVSLLTILCCGGISTADQASEQSLPLKDIQRFTGIIEIIRNYYVNPVEDDALFENAIRGMVGGLDPHSSYLDTEEFADLKVNTTGKFGGLGIEVSMEDGFVRIISPIDDGPAQLAGVKAGDVIIKIDETPVKGLSLKKAVDMMRGEKGTPIKLTLLRKGEDKPIILTFKRDIITVQSVKSKMLEPGYGYIRLAQFQAHTGSDMAKHIKDLSNNAPNKKLQGLILDLRNNPGGVLEASVQVCNTLLESGHLGYENLIVYTEGRLSDSQIREKATAHDMLKGAPLIVLVNGGSASASEIVAGALQDHKRAIILGTRTFGKGSVQTVLPLQDNHEGIKLTTALYFTPSGRSIQATGIIPDIVIPELKLPTTEDKHKEQSWFSLKESDLQGHLKNGAEKLAIKAPEKESEENKKPPTTSDRDHFNDDEAPVGFAISDYQLNEALNLLKGLTINQENKKSH